MLDFTLFCIDRFGIIITDQLRFLLIKTLKMVDFELVYLI